MTYRTHLPRHPNDVLRVVASIWVGPDAAALVFTDLVLVDHPFQGAAVAAAVLEGFRRDAGQRQ